MSFFFLEEATPDNFRCRKEPTLTPIQTPPTTSPPLSTASNNYSLVTTPLVPDNNDRQLQQQLFHTNRWHIARGETEVFSVLVATYCATFMATLSHFRRLQNPVELNTSSLIYSTTPLIARRSTSRNRRCPQILRCRHHRNITNAKHWLPFKFFYCSRNQTTSTSRLSTIEPICTMQPFSHGKYICTKRYNMKRQSHMQIRFKGCISRCAGTPRIKKVFKLQARELRVPIQVSRIWPKCHAKSFHQTYALRRRTFTATRHPFSVLSRRYMSSRQIVNRNADHLDHSNQSPDEARLSHKLEEEHSPTVSPGRISGILLQFSNYEDSSSAVKNQQTS